MTNYCDVPFGHVVTVSVSSPLVHRAFVSVTGDPLPVEVYWVDVTCSGVTDSSPASTGVTETHTHSSSCWTPSDSTYGSSVVMSPSSTVTAAGAPYVMASPDAASVAGLTSLEFSCEGSAMVSVAAMTVGSPAHRASGSASLMVPSARGSESFGPSKAPVASPSTVRSS